MKKIIDENIKYYVKNILFTIFIVLLTIPAWQLLDNSSYASIAEYYDNYINSGVNTHYLVNAYDESENKYIIQLNLENTKKENYSYLLLLKIRKDTNDKNIKIDLFGETHNIEELRYTYSEGYDYYLIDMNNLVKNRDYKFEIILPNEITNIIYSFDLIENN